MFLIWLFYVSVWNDSYPVPVYCRQNVFPHTDLSRNLVNIARAAKKRLEQRKRNSCKILIKKINKLHN